MTDRDFSPRTLAESRARYLATHDAAERHERIYTDLINGVPKHESIAVCTPEDEAFWDRLAPSVARDKRSGMEIEYNIPSDEDDWGPNGEWLGEDAARRRRPGRA